MLFEDLSVIVDRNQSVFIVKLFLNFLYLLDCELPHFIVFCLEKQYACSWKAILRKPHKSGFLWEQIQLRLVALWLRCEACFVSS
jgi:hypothetical protein